jgi:LPS-assembly protein
VDTEQPILPAIALCALLTALPNTARATQPWDCHQDADGEWICNPGGAPPPAPTLVPEAAGGTSQPDLSAPDEVLLPGRGEHGAEPLPAAEPSIPAGKVGVTEDTAVGGLAPLPAGPAVVERPEVVPTPSRRLTHFGPEELVAPRYPFELCSPWPPLLAPVRAEPLPHTPREEAPLRLFADHAELTPEQRSVYTGDVILLRADQHLEADRVVYDGLAREVQASGDVRFRQRDFVVAGRRGHLDLETDQGEFEDAEFRLEDRHARGTARHAHFDGPLQSRLSGVAYTTCDPGRRDWELRATRVDLDRARGAGTARNATLRIGGVPILYSPWLSFPIDDRRKSGFLPPSFGTSSTTGADLRTPYYWNIAPHRDATITPRLMADRGVMMIGEFRYLNPTSAGIVNAEFLPDDRETGDNRGAVSVRHRGALTPRLTTDIDVNHVSDARYFEDFGDSLSVASLTHQERRADLRYRAERWSLLGRVQGYQTIDPTIPAQRRPYQRLPQLLFEGALADQPFGLAYRVQAEYVNFERNAGVTGSRVDLMPSLSLPVAELGWFVTPALALRHTRYELDDTDPGAPSDPSRTVPIFSLDTGVFLERDLIFAGAPLLQTLEPRLFYLYVPFREQQDLPVFDSGLRGFSFARMFTENRFTGADRVGDANQVTVALTSRFLERATGAERLSASVGQIYYFRDRLVTLPGTEPPSEGSSDLLGEIAARPLPSWRTSAGIQWNPHFDQAEVGSLDIQYLPDRSRVLNLGYRYRRDDIEQTDLSFLWPLGPQWRLVGRWNYSLRESRTLETLAGVEYESCCWGLRIAVRDYLVNAEGETDTGIYLQLVLKGLTSLGQDVENLLEHGILGYRAR